jgi:hypothetical protein
MKIEKFLQLAPVGLTLVSLQDLIVSALKNREVLALFLYLSFLSRGVVVGFGMVPGKLLAMMNNNPI